MPIKYNDFQKSLKFTLKWEGGYVNDKDDPGGETKWGISKRCVSPESLILTSELKWVRADSLVVGDLLMAFDEVPERLGKLNLRRFRTSVVEEVGPVRLPASRVVTETRSFVAGDEHQWLRRWGSHRVFNWSTTKDLLQHSGKWTNGVDVRIGTLMAPWDVIGTRAAGYLAGVLDGEGSISGTLDFAQKKDNALVKQALLCAEELGLQFREGNLRHGVCSYRLVGGTTAFDAVAVVGRLGATRLLDRAAKRLVGKSIASTKVVHDKVLSVESVGEQDLIGIQTATKTLIVDGYLSHNSYPKEDITNLTPERAAEIYEKDYWLASGCDSIPFPYNSAVFDSAVNCGLTRVRDWLRRAKDVNEFLELRKQHYFGIINRNPPSVKYLRGWMNRLTDLQKYIQINSSSI